MREHTRLCSVEKRVEGRWSPKTWLAFKQGWWMGKWATAIHGRTRVWLSSDTQTHQVCPCGFASLPSLFPENCLLTSELWELSWASHSLASSQSPGEPHMEAALHNEGWGRGKRFLLGFKSWPCHSPTLRPWATAWPCLSLSLSSSENKEKDIYFEVQR